MRVSDFQKKTADNWEGYSGFDIKTENIRYAKMRDYIREEGDGKEILDLGCLDGSLTEPFVKNNQVSGLDISERFVQESRKKGLNTVLGDVEKPFPFKTGQFDIVVAGQIIEHIANTDFFLFECNGVLKDNGKLILSVPNINTLFSAAILFFFDYPPPSASRYRSAHVKDFTFSTLKVALKNNFFIVEKKRGSIFYIPYFKRLLPPRSYIGDLIPRLANDYIVKARKEKSFIYNEEKNIKETRFKSIAKEMPLLKWFLK